MTASMWTWGAADPLDSACACYALELGAWRKDASQKSYFDGNKFVPLQPLEDTFGPTVQSYSAAAVLFP